MLHSHKLFRINKWGIEYERMRLFSSLAVLFSRQKVFLLHQSKLRTINLESIPVLQSHLQSSKVKKNNAHRAINPDDATTVIFRNWTDTAVIQETNQQGETNFGETNFPLSVTWQEVKAYLPASKCFASDGYMKATIFVEANSSSAIKKTTL